jgi:hypothetical protein
MQGGGINLGRAPCRYVLARGGLTRTPKPAWLLGFFNSVYMCRYFSTLSNIMREERVGNMGRIYGEDKNPTAEFTDTPTHCPAGSGTGRGLPPPFRKTNLMIRLRAYPTNLPSFSTPTRTPTGGVSACVSLKHASPPTDTQGGPKGKKSQPKPRLNIEMQQARPITPIPVRPDLRKGTQVTS